LREEKNETMEKKQREKGDLKVKKQRKR